MSDRGWSIGKVVGSVAGVQVAFTLAAIASDQLGPTTGPWTAVAVLTTAVAALVAAGFVRSLGA